MSEPIIGTAAAIESARGLDHLYVYRPYGAIPAWDDKCPRGSDQESWSSFRSLASLDKHDRPAGGTEPIYVKPAACSYGSYCGTSDIEYSNFRILESEYRDSLVIVGYSDHDGQMILIRADEMTEDLLSIVDGLNDYPVIDEQDSSRVVDEWTMAAWDSYARADLLSDLRDDHETADILDSIDDPDEFLADVFWQAVSDGNEYPYADGHESIVFPDWKLIVGEISTIIRALAAPATPILIHSGQESFNF